MGVLVALVAVGACAGPTVTDRGYEKKAGKSAQALASAVATVQLAVRVASQDRATSAYVQVLIEDAESSVDGVDTAFMSRWAPTRAGDDLREELGGLLQQVDDAVAGLRIAVRRGDVAQM